MSRRTLLYFVCSPHSRTGVTTTARLITDYYLARGLAVDGFDTDSREPSYALRYPDLSKVVDIFSVQHHMGHPDLIPIPGKEFFRAHRFRGNGCR